MYAEKARVTKENLGEEIGQPDLECDGFLDEYGFVFTWICRGGKLNWRSLGKEWLQLDLKDYSFWDALKNQF